MKNAFKLNLFLLYGFAAILFLSISACHEEQAIPVPDVISHDFQITNRTDGPVNAVLVKQKVATRDNIPLSQILTCTYYGLTSLGFWEYHLTTQCNGPKIYIVTEIIGDDFEGA